MTTELQLRVWKKLTHIPRGKITTYKELARAVGKPNAHRAVASAVGKNPNLIIVPCHRVVRSDGSVGQYAKGTKEKKYLLKQEGIYIKSGKVDGFDNVFYTFY